MTLSGLAAKRIRGGLADEEADGRQRQANENHGVHEGEGETVDDVDQTGGLHDLVPLIVRCGTVARISLVKAGVWPSFCVYRYSRIVFQSN
jgi:hypothetical protein